jgi:hypothetical protein
MKLRTLLTTVAAAAAATCWAVAGALGESPASDAAGACLQAPQLDYYQVVDDTPDAGPELDFGDLAHGSDEAGTYILASNQGDCVSFVARNTKGKNSNINGQAYLVVIFKTAVISGY